MGMFSKPKGPSQAELLAQQEASAKAEKQRLSEERSEQEQQALSELKQKESKRAAFVGQLNQSIDEQNTGRKKFLRGV